MRPSDLLIQALSKIDVEGQWTQGSSARDANGYYVNPGSRVAVQFCSVGALEACYQEEMERCGQARRPEGSFLTYLERTALFQKGEIFQNYTSARDYLYRSSMEVKTAQPIPSYSPEHINDQVTSQFDPEMTAMWLGAIFAALADESDLPEEAANSKERD
jgi:hypothetical protein